MSRLVSRNKHRTSKGSSGSPLDGATAGSSLKLAFLPGELLGTALDSGITLNTESGTVDNSIKFDAKIQEIYESGVVSGKEGVSLDQSLYKEESREDEGVFTELAGLSNLEMGLLCPPRPAQSPYLSSRLVDAESGGHNNISVEDDLDTKNGAVDNSIEFDAGNPKAYNLLTCCYWLAGFVLVAGALAGAYILGLRNGKRACPQMQCPQTQVAQSPPQSPPIEFESTTTPGPTPCGDGKFDSTLGEIFFKEGCLADTCTAAEAGAFVDYLTSELRFESIVFCGFSLLALFVLLQFGGIPSIMAASQKSDEGAATEKPEYSPFGIALWATWMGTLVLQYVTTLMSLVLAMLATFGMLSQHRACFVEMGGGLGSGWGALIGAGVLGVPAWCFRGYHAVTQEDVKDEWVKILLVLTGPACVGAALGALYGTVSNSTFFATTVPALVFHPTFVSKQAALLAYYFVFLQGLQGAGFANLNFNVKSAVLYYCTIVLGAWGVVGTGYVLFSASFVFSAFIYIPVVVVMAASFALFFGGGLKLLLAAASVNEINVAHCDISFDNPLAVLKDATWFLPPAFDLGNVLVPYPSRQWLELALGSRILMRHLNLASSSAMLLLVEGSLMFLVLSATIVLGSWTAFYCYIGHSPATNMEFVIQAYYHFFGVFVDREFRYPHLFSFDFSAISQWSAILDNVPAFDTIPPDVTLEGSRMFAALSLIMAFIKPLVSAIAFLSSAAGLVAKNKPVLEVAKSTATADEIADSPSFEGIVTGFGGAARLEAMQLMGYTCGNDDKGNLISIKATGEHLLDIKDLCLKEFVHLQELNFKDNSNVTGTFTGSVVRLISNIRATHGKEAVQLEGCGRFVLAEDLSDIADINHIDLSGINSLEGTFTGSIVRLIGNIRAKHGKEAVQLKGCGRFVLAEDFCENIADIAHIDLSDINSLEGTFTGSIVRLISNIRAKHGKEAVQLKGCGRFVLAEDFCENIADIAHIDLSDINSLEGTFTGSVVRLISNIRAKHGKEAVQLKGCGRFVLAEDFSDIADITHIDLSEINSLEGTFTGSVVRLISDNRAKYGKEAVQLKGCGRFVLAEDFSDIADITHIDLSGINSLEGTFTGSIVRLISNIRAKHGKEAVQFKGCGRFVLAEDFSDIADITHVDLSGISSLEGTFTDSVVRLISNIRAKHGKEAVQLKGCGRFVLVEDSSDIADITHVDLSDINSLEGTFTGSVVRLISNIRAKHGKEAVQLEGCGRFVLAEDFSDIADIAHVDLSGISSLEGDIMVFGHTKTLKCLNIEGCKEITGDIGDALRNLVNLESVDFTLCKNITGDIEVFANCPQLSCLRAEKTAITGDISVFSNLTKVTRINMGHTDVSGDITVFEHTKQLKALDTYWCEKLTGDIKVFEHTKQLKTLDTSCCAELAGDIKVFDHTKLLEKLDMQDCRVTGGIEVFEHTKALETLDIRRCKEITGDIKVFEHTKGLKEVNMYKCDEVIGDIEVFEHTKQLRGLNIGRCHKITGDIMVFEHTKALKSLNMCRCKDITGDIKVFEHTNGLNDLNMYNCEKLTGDIAVFGNLTKATEINMGDTKVTGDIKAFEHTIALETLDIRWCKKITGDKGAIKKSLPQCSFNM